MNTPAFDPKNLSVIPTLADLEHLSLPDAYKAIDKLLTELWYRDCEIFMEGEPGEFAMEQRKIKKKIKAVSDIKYELGKRLDAAEDLGAAF